MKKSNDKEMNKLSQLLREAENDSVFLELSQNIEGRYNLVVPEGSMKAFIAAAILKVTDKPLLFIMPDELRLRTIKEFCEAFCDSNEICEIKAVPMQMSFAEAVSRDAEMNRLASIISFIEGKKRLAFTTAAAMSARLPSPDRVWASIIRLNISDTEEPGDLAEKLSELGYAAASMCEEKGEFSLRGDILDIFGTVGSPIRISFMDNEIDEIKSFDPETQRSTGALASASVYPVRESCDALINDRKYISDAIRSFAAGRSLKFKKNQADDAVVKRFERGIERELDQIEEDRECPGILRWGDITYGKERFGLLDFAKKAGALVLLDELGNFTERLYGNEADFRERLKGMLLRGEAVEKTMGSKLEAAEVLKTIDGRKQILHFVSLPSSKNAFPGATKLRFKGRASESFAGRMKEIEGWIKDRSSEGTEVHIFAGPEKNNKTLTDEASNAGLSCIFHDSLIERGFTYEGAGIAVLGRLDLYGNEAGRTRRRRISGDESKNTLRLRYFRDLKKGDKVVHEEHGIGLYEGISNTCNWEGKKRDYLTVKFAGEERLYLPMDQLDRLRKYVGTDADSVKLSRLGGNEWARSKERARSSIKKLAVDLVKLYGRRKELRGHAFPPDTPWDAEFADSFPYEETTDQLRCIEDVKNDMESEKVMDRLLCGDVGFGKTEVAFRAIFKCVQDGKQAAMLAPTTVLCEQHGESLRERIGSFPVKVEVLSRFSDKKKQKRIVKAIASGAVDVVIGTHRLLSGDVKFKDLGLLVVDEEQRFGVNHKEKIKALNPDVDVLTLSATPIPRTLHMSMSGIRDISVIDEPPEERRPIYTELMEYDPVTIDEAVLREVERGGQVFYLYNRTESIDEKAASLAERLPGIRITVCHGKLHEHDLEDRIESFIRGEADMMVCTTIIESGIDMPRVNTLIVENAERLGLAQLYQIRGRVGRSDRQAYAYITYDPGKILNEEAEKRLKAIRDFTELGAGFKIAMRDLEVRGAGNILGAEQHGQMNAIGYDLYTRMLDEEISAAREKAESTLQKSFASTEERKPIKKNSRAAFEIDLESYIPDSYISDEGERMDVYRRISSISEKEDYMDVMDELIDRYGDVPAELIRLMDVAFVRSAAGSMGFSSVRSANDGAELILSENPAEIDMEKISALMNARSFKNMLSFNAGENPCVKLKLKGKDENQYPGILKRLFEETEEAYSAVKTESKNKTNGKAVKADGRQK